MTISRDSNGSETHLKVWNSSILVPETSISGTYQLQSTGNWYTVKAITITYRQGTSAEQIVNNSYTIYY